MHRSLLALDEGDLDQAQERTLLEADLEYVASEGKWWRGAHFLGAGATGSCTLWLRVDDKDNIEERLAVRAVEAMHQRRWIEITNRRDRLPREIAIMKRLHDQSDAGQNIHRYFGHASTCGSDAIVSTPNYVTLETQKVRSNTILEYGGTSISGTAGLNARMTWKRQNATIPRCRETA